MFDLKLMCLAFGVLIATATTVFSDEPISIAMGDENSNPKQPQAAIDLDGTVHLVYGDGGGSSSMTLLEQDTALNKAAIINKILYFDIFNFCLKMILTNDFNAKILRGVFFLKNIRLYYDSKLRFKQDTNNPKGIKRE